MESAPTVVFALAFYRYYIRHRRGGFYIRPITHYALYQPSAFVYPHHNVHALNSRTGRTLAEIVEA